MGVLQIFALCNQETDLWFTNPLIPTLYFNEERDYPEENTCNHEVFCSLILYYSRAGNKQPTTVKTSWQFKSAG